MLGQMRIKEARLWSQTQPQRASIVTPDGTGKRAAAGAAHTDALREKVRPLVVSIVTDFEAHALWMDDGVDL
jgi:hypothetical protein